MLLLTWFIFVVNPFIGMIFVSIGLYNDRKNSIHYAIMSALFFASLAYWFIPSHEIDLTRYFSQLESMAKVDFIYFLKNYFIANVFFAEYTLFFLVAKTHNVHLLPAVVIFTTYFIIFYMITNYANLKKISSRKMFFALWFVIAILPFPTVVSNVRNILAFAIFSLAIYRDLILDKRDWFTYSLYLISISLHISSITLLLARLVLPYFNTKKRKVIISSTIIGATYLVSFLSTIVQATFLKKITVLSSFFIKANNYVLNTESDYASYLRGSLFMSLQKFFFVLVIALILIILATTYFNNKQGTNPNRDNGLQLYPNFFSFFSILIFIVIGAAPLIIPVYMRFVFPVLLLSFVLIFEYESQIEFFLFRNAITLSLAIASFAGIVHQIAYMTQLTDIKIMVTSVMVRNLLNMFFM